MASSRGAKPARVRERQSSGRLAGAMTFPDSLGPKILRVLCTYGGQLSLTALHDTLTQRALWSSSESALQQFMAGSCPHGAKLFHFENDPVRNECTVRVKTEAVLCKSYNPRRNVCTEGVDCEAVHICRHFVLGKCEKGRKCPWPHELRSPHNDAILFKNGLETLSDDHILQILRLSWVEFSLPDVCKHYNRQTGCAKDNCTFLHVCRHYILGDCRYTRPDRQPCLYSHDVKDRQPMTVWRRFRIDAASYSPVELLRMLRDKKTQTSPSEAEEEDEDDDDDDEDDSDDDGDGDDLSLMRSPTRKSGKTAPGICIHYNGKGCLKGNTCPYLHVCRYLATGHCRFADKCRRSHNAKDSQPMAVWKAFGIDARSRPQEDLLALLRKSSPSDGQGGGDSGSRRSLSSLQGAASENLEICEYHLRGKCDFGDGCRKLHADQHYQWQYTPDDGQTWTNFDRNVAIEELYCDFRVPWVKCQSGILTFETLKFGAMDARRLETPAINPTEANSWQSVLATKWQWHFLDNDNIWVQFGNNAQVEEAYQKFLSTKQDPTFEFDTESFRYVLDFPSMKQTNKKLGTVRNVRRRPKFVTKDVRERSLQKQKVLGVILPKSWDAHVVSSDPESNYALCKLDRKRHVDEYRLVAGRFAEKMDDSAIVRIERVQNTELWHEFTVRRDYMRERQDDPGKSLAELLLFHGTEQKVVQAICQQNFDHRMSGTRVGTKYGHGSYFSRSAKYSDNYATPGPGGRARMFLVRVLVGSYTQGDPSYRRPPLKDPGKLHGPLFDSCVDSPVDPLIFVVFDRRQVYPEYLITYKK